MILIQDLLDIIKTKLVNLLIYRFGAQVNQERSVPQNCSTPFYENRYQIHIRGWHCRNLRTNYLNFLAFLC